MSKNVFPIEQASIGKTSDGTYAADMGVDINAPVGTAVVAIGAGEIVYSESGHTPWTAPPDTPNSVKILLDEPIIIGGVGYRYAWYTHLSELARHVPAGQGGARIAAGDPVGKTGLGRGVPHLHFTLAGGENLDEYCPPFVLRDWLYGLIGVAPTPAPAPEPEPAAPQNVGLDSDVLLWEGSTGPKVEHLQMYLTARGYALKVDGILGPVTSRCVAAFQADFLKREPDGSVHPIAVDAIVGPETWATLSDGVPRYELYRGMENADDPTIISFVQRAQEWANLRGGFNLAVDGDFGPLTESAIANLQNRYGLAKDGIIGKLTWHVLIFG